MSNNRELISLDIGRAKTGLARASTIARLAEPLESIKTDKLIERLNQLISEKDVEAFVIGLPRSLDGNDTDQTRWVRDFVNKLKTEVSRPLYWQDEALTTIASVRDGSHKHDDHQLAAKIILQDWIDTPEPERVLC